MAVGSKTAAPRKHVSSAAFTVEGREVKNLPLARFRTERECTSETILKKPTKSVHRGKAAEIHRRKKKWSGIVRKELVQEGSMQELEGKEHFSKNHGRAGKSPSFSWSHSGVAVLPGCTGGT